jgi:hypothetical protein
MILCKELNKEFNSKQEMFTALKESKSDIISFKKAQIYKSFEKGISVKSKPIDVYKFSEVNKEDFKDENYYYIVVNTTKILDSHRDLHIDGIWNRTVKNQNRRNYLLDSHVMHMTTTIARKENVEILLSEIPFSLIGSSLKGNTQALIYKIPKDKVINTLAKEWLDSGDDIEASVRMQYVQIELAMDSESPEDEFYKNNFDTYINQIANKAKYEEDEGEISYFWVVKEAKNIGESSLVLQGSNSETGQIIIDSSADTQSKEALEKSRQEEVKQYIINKNLNKDV